MNPNDPIETVWGLFQPPQASQIAWMVRQPEIMGGGLSSLAQMRAFADRYKTDCYFTPNPVVPGFGRRPSSAHVAYVRCLLIDLDPCVETIQIGGAEAQRRNSGSIVGRDISPTNPRDAVSRLLWTGIEERVISYAQNLLGLELHPDRIDSGRGRQLWLRFEPTPVVSQEEKSLWRTAIGAFLYRLDQDCGDLGGFRVDTSCSDLPRLVRLPGTINSKTGNRAGFYGEPGQVHQGFGEALLERFGVPPAPKPRPSGGDWRRSYHLLSARAKRFFADGWAEPGRHSAAFAAAASMKNDVGAGYDITERMVLLGAMKCSPPLDPHEARRCTRNAFKEDLIGS